MEEDLKIFKVEYLSNQLLDHIQMLSLSLDDKIKFSKWRQPSIGEDLKWKTFNGRGPQMEDDMNRSMNSFGFDK